jgi:hypothetical protein
MEGGSCGEKGLVSRRFVVEELDRRESPPSPKQKNAASTPFAFILTHSDANVDTHTHNHNYTKYF